MLTQNTASHYDRTADEYEERWKGYLSNTHTKLLNAFIPDLTDNDVILDASCGTGLLAHQLIQRKSPFKELVLNDLSPRMLGIAKERLPDDDRLSYSAWPVENLEFEDNRFTKIICLNAFHNYDNPSVAVGQFKQILTPDGRLYILDWNKSGWFRIINKLLVRSGTETINTFNLKEISRLLEEHQYHIDYTDTWSYSYWKLFLVVGGFQPWKTFHL